MADAITDALKNIRSRKREVEGELKRLVKAEEVLRQILNPGGITKAQEKSEAPVSAENTSGAGGVSNAVKAALGDLGEAESSEIISQIRKKYLPNVNENTVRSLLSVWAVKGRVVRNDKKYSLPKEAQKEAFSS